MYVDTTSGPDDDPRRAQRTFLLTLLARAKTLLRTQPPPNTYRLGQEYLDDRESTDCTIVIWFMFPGSIGPLDFWHNRSHVTISQKAPFLTVVINRRISARLWTDLRLLQRGERFIVGYVSALMPTINRRLLDNRYLSGQPLSRTFSLLEAAWISVTSRQDQVHLNWPVALQAFPPSALLAPDRAEVYLRDFVDAIHSLLRNDFDDCIRRIVTSVETFFEFRGWTAGGNTSSSVRLVRRAVSLLLSICPIWKKTMAVRPNSFRNILAHNVEASSLQGRVVRDNLKEIYGIRNRIVHQGLRLRPTSGTFCIKAVETLRYFIQRFSGDRTTSKYAHSLGMQLSMIQGLLGRHHDLDQLRTRYSTPPSQGQTVTNAAQHDAFVFTGLRFTERDRRSAT